MRTNVVLDDDLVREARRYAKGRTKRALLEEALRTFIEVREAQRRAATYGERLRSLDGRLADLRLRQSPSDLLREDRNRP